MSAVPTSVLLSAALLMLVVLPEVSLGWGSNSPSRSRLLQLQRLRVSTSDYLDDDDDGVDDDYPSDRRSSRRGLTLWDRGTASTRRTFNRMDSDDDDYLEDYIQYRRRAFSRLRQLRDDYYRNRKSGDSSSDDYSDDIQSSGQRRAVWGARQVNNRGISRLYARFLEYLQSRKQ
ncbi:uncharacterized protein [Haliotis asinina]|uniref:uncharacterized protein n=1 Tax=Haliotis asinina TaxID=109174 RepID=UPI003531DF69